ATVIAGLSADLDRLAGETAVRQATLTSAVLGFLSALLSVMLSSALTMARRALASNRRSGPMTLLEHATDTGAGFVLVVPPIVVGAGWFLLLRHVGDVFAIAPLMVVTV
ncbi:thiamine/thiamine pyrophosphate ABC transporter permease ThiP, partial [Mesorhizobium sp. M2D.F.Ca.ET.160.01.1.1]